MTVAVDRPYCYDNRLHEELYYSEAVAGAHIYNQPKIRLYAITRGHDSHKTEIASHQCIAISMPLYTVWINKNSDWIPGLSHGRVECTH